MFYVLILAVGICAYFGALLVLKLKQTEETQREVENLKRNLLEDTHIQQTVGLVQEAICRGLRIWVDENDVYHIGHKITYSPEHNLMISDLRLHSLTVSSTGTTLCESEEPHNVTSAGPNGHWDIAFQCDVCGRPYPDGGCKSNSNMEIVYFDVGVALKEYNKGELKEVVICTECIKAIQEME